jgi:hypothetical protein
MRRLIGFSTSHACQLSVNSLITCLGRKVRMDFRGGQVVVAEEAL